ncbi:MAG: SCO1664 family protein, partial [Candidatus Rokuibacteriota bacterium]
PDGRVWAIDNALTFHAEPKLRTVIWDFGGAAIPAPILDDVTRVQRAGLPAPLADLLDPAEQRALLKRARALVRAARFPDDDGGYRYPWPLV